MIKEIEEKDLQNIVKFAWELSRDKRKRSFPKIDTYKDMYNIFEKAIKDEKDKVLALYENGELKGVLNLIISPEDNYIQGNGGIYSKDNFSNTATQFINYIKTHYTNYEVIFNYPSTNYEAINYMEEIQAELIESCIVMELDNLSFNYIEQLNNNLVINLKPNNYKEFAIFHDTNNPEMYWNSQRLLEKPNSFDIFILMKDEKIVGSIIISIYEVVGKKAAEIFGLTIDDKFQDAGLELALLSKSIKSTLDKGVENIIYFIEKDSKNELDAATQIGFKEVDDYNSYGITI